MYIYAPEIEEWMALFGFVYFIWPHTAASPSIQSGLFQLSPWLAEQEVRGSIPDFGATISEIGYLAPASQSRYGWKIAKAT